MKDTPQIAREIAGAARKFLGVSAAALAREADISPRKLRATMREDSRARWLDYAELGELRLAFYWIDVKWSGPDALTRGEEWGYALVEGVHRWTSPSGEVVEVKGLRGAPARLMGVRGARLDGSRYVVLGEAGAAHLRDLGA